MVLRRLCQVSKLSRRVVPRSTGHLLHVHAYPFSTKPTLPKLEPEESRKAQLRKRLFFRFLDYLSGYGKNVLDKILPSKAVQFYR